MKFGATFCDSPVGRLTVIASDAGLRSVLWPGDVGRVKTPPHEMHVDQPILIEVCGQLSEYFAHQRTQFELPLDPAGTEFQRAVWTRLRTIPYGQTITYGALAASIGRPDAARAVGAANGKNPISIIVPCHRVLSVSGALTGFAGGLDVKQTLLDHESGINRLS